jgi:FAD/FMN-containing dehydrogenase
MRLRGNAPVVAGVRTLVTAVPEAVGESLVTELKGALDGQVITSGDAEYDRARTVFYRGFDRHPGVIVRPRDAQQVARVVSLAREAGAELAVRSGGHSLAGHGVSEGGIVLDLANMRALDIDVERRTAWAETGLTAGQYTTAAGEHGLATGFGDTGSVGIGGLTLGGGVGFLVRKHGLTIDELLAADIVTADGELLRVDDETHPDLFWAIRGGGGNFGVATRFHYRLREVDTILGGMLILPATAEVVASFVARSDEAPEELSAIANIMVAPPMPFLPKEAHGKVMVMALISYAGDVSTGERVLAPLRELAEPIADMVRPMKYPEIYALFGEEAGPGPTHDVAQSLFVDEIDRDLAEAIVEHLRASSAPLAVSQLRVLGGAAARVPVDETAYAHRGRRIMVANGAIFERADETPIHQAWLESLVGSLAQDDAGVYVNFLGDEGASRVREAYPGSTWDRLVSVKRRYDPTNLFRLNQNIPPD